MWLCASTHRPNAIRAASAVGPENPVKVFSTLWAVASNVFVESSNDCRHTKASISCVRACCAITRASVRAFNGAAARS